jgi:hypothetical protein
MLLAGLAVLSVTPLSGAGRRQKNQVMILRAQDQRIRDREPRLRAGAIRGRASGDHLGDRARLRGQEPDQAHRRTGGRPGACGLDTRLGGGDPGHRPHRRHPGHIQPARGAGCGWLLVRPEGAFSAAMHHVHPPDPSDCIAAGQSRDYACRRSPARRTAVPRRRGCRSGQVPLKDPGKRRAEISRMMDTAGTGSPADTAELAQHRPSRHWRGLPAAITPTAPASSHPEDR